jgi:hypothetical protein
MSEEPLKLLTDKSASMGKGKDKSSKPDHHHHSDKLDRKKMPVEKKANSKSIDTSSRTRQKNPYRLCHCPQRHPGQPLRSQKNE